MHDHSENRSLLWTHRTPCESGTSGKVTARMGVTFGTPVDLLAVAGILCRDKNDSSVLLFGFTGTVWPTKQVKVRSWEFLSLAGALPRHSELSLARLFLSSPPNHGDESSLTSVFNATPTPTSTPDLVGPNICILVSQEHATLLERTTSRMTSVVCTLHIPCACPPTAFLPSPFSRLGSLMDLVYRSRHTSSPLPLCSRSSLLSHLVFSQRPGVAVIGFYLLSARSLTRVNRCICRGRSFVSRPRPLVEHGREEG